MIEPGNNEGKGRGGRRSSAVFRSGGVCLAFLIIGYQAALFVHRATVLKIEQVRDHPDTVYVLDEAVAQRVLSDLVVQDSSVRGLLAEYLAVRPVAHGGRRNSEIRSNKETAASNRGYTVPGAGMSSGRTAEEIIRNPHNAACPDLEGRLVLTKNSEHPKAVQNVRQNRRRVESFRFDPNTASVEDLMRLGFSEKQAQSIDNYRSKGGRFRRKEDFAKSFVVADSVFRRLEKYIDIPKTDINKADSAAFDALPGIGPWFAKKMVEYRDRLGGYSYKEQLMDIYRFDETKYKALSDLIVCSEPEPFRLWSLPADSLRKHPYINSWAAAKAIVLYRENTPASQRRVSALGSETGILPDSLAVKLARCRIE